MRPNRLSAPLIAPVLHWLLLAALAVLPAQADFTLLMRDLTGGSDGNPGSAVETKAILALGAPNAQYAYTDFTQSPDPETINVGGGGTYSPTNPLPSGPQQANSYCLKATANVIIPAGTWTVGFGSDDGGSIIIPGVTFSSRFNNNGTPAADEVIYNRGRGHAWTGGTFTLASQLETTIEAIMWEGGGGDSWELAFAQGTQGGHNGNWRLMEDGVFGWTVQVAALIDLDPPVITQLSPADDSTQVFRGTDLVATFDEGIALTGNGTITITDLTNGTDNYTINLPDASVTVDGSQLIIGSPGTLAIENDYAVEISSDAIEDLSEDNTANGGPNDFPGISGTTTWNFTTVELDPTPPAVVDTLPADEAEFVRLDETLTATFDDEIVIGSGNIYVYDIAAATNVQTINVTDGSQVTVSGHELIINTASIFEPEKELAIRWDAGIVQNLTDVSCAANSGNSWSFTTTSATLASSIIVTNHGFETDIVADDDFSGATSPAHWNLVVDQGSIQFSGVWNPPAVWSGNSFDSYYTLEAPEGVNIAYVTPNEADSQVGFSQVLGTAYLAANPSESQYPANCEFIVGVDYQLKVRLGQSGNYPATGYRLQLLAGGVILAEDVNTLSVPQDSFVEATLEYIHDPANAALAGNLLEIRLLSIDDISTPFGGGAGMDFDDVRLTYGYTSPQADPGGPYTVTPTYDLFLDGANSRPADLATITSYEWDLNNDGVFGDVANVAQPESGGLTNIQLIGTYGLELGDNTISLRITDSSGQTSTATTNVRIDFSTVTPGADFVLIADEDDGLNDRWEDLAAGNPSGLELLLDTVGGVAWQPVTSTTQITHAYDFPGGQFGNFGGALLVSTGTSTHRSFQSSPDDWSDNAITMEIWFKPNELQPFPLDGQILFEDGGNTGLGLFIANNELVCGQDAGNPIISYDLSTDPSGLLIGGNPATDEFIQVVVTRTQTGVTIMYVNGTQVGTANDDDGDWSGGDAAAFGTLGGTNVGGLDNNGFPDTESFNGQIALVRLYSEEVLTPAQVLENFNAVNATDNIPPFVEAYSPDDDSTNILITSNFDATFDSDVVLTGSGTVTLKNLSGGSDVTISLPDAQVQLNGRVLTIDPSSNLDYGTDYAVRITGDAIEDTAGTPNAYAGILDDTTWNFSTVPQDLTAPVLIGMNPPDNAFDVSPVGTVLQATFDDTILADAGNIVIWELDPETMAGTSIHATIPIGDTSQVGIAGNVLSIAPATPLVGGTAYAVHIASGAVTNTTYVDFAGISDDTTWNFLLGTPLFTDNFESPDVTAGQSDPDDTSQQVDTAKWVRTTVGFDADRCGIIDEASGQITDPTGQQAFAFRASNAGVTTALDAIGDLAGGVTYQISFDVAEDGETNGKSYSMALVTFDNAGANSDREDAIVMGNGTTSILHTVTGSAPAGGAYQTVSFEYTAPPGEPGLGDDLALRFMGTASSAMIDNVNVTLAVTPDTVPPYVVSIVDNVGGADILTNDVVIYTISFIEDIQGVSLTAADFSNAGSSQFTINSITETEETSGIFQVSVTPITVGTLQLQISAGAEILDMGGNAMDTNTPIVDDTLIQVGYDGPNEIPVFTSDPFSTADATEDAPYSATIAGSATDADTGPADVLTYAKVAGPDWLSVAGDGTLSGTPTNDDVGLNAFTVSVNDSKLIYPIEATLNITVLNTNDAPSFNEDPITGAPATEDAAYSGTLADFASDPDVSDTLTFAKVSGPAWLSVASDGTLSGTPLSADLGANIFTVSVTDSIIATPIQATLNITVFFVNDASEVDAGEDQWVNMTEVEWTPAEMSTVAWYDASNAASITDAGGGAVSAWADLSGNGKHLTQTIENRRPTTGIRALNGLNVLDFDENPADNLISDGELTHDMVYIVTFNDGMSYSNRPTVLGGSSSTSYTVQFSNNSQTNNPDGWVGGTFLVNGNTTNASSGDAALVTAGPTLIRRNQVLGNTKISVGSDRQIAPRAWDGYVAEVIYLNGASVDEQRKIEGYLMHKWGLVANLPSGHPYKSAPPAPESVIGVANLDGSAIDEEGDSLAYSWTDTGTGTGTGAIGFSDDTILNPTFSATGIGSYVLRLTADDGNSIGEDFVTINFVVDNDDPTLASVDIVDDQGGADVIEGTNVTYTLTFSEDMDPSTLNPADFSNAGTASILLGDITYISPGVFTVEMMPISTGTLQLQVPIGATLTDRVGKALDTSTAIVDDTTITVNPGPPNETPVFTQDPFSTADATEDAAYSATIAGSATDADTDPADTLTYAKVAGPAWLSVASDGTLSGTPSNDDVGLNAFTVSVDDGKVFVPVEATLNITVLNTNDIPFFTEDPIDAPDATEDVAYTGSLATYVDDPDAGDTLSFAKLSGPAWLNVASDGTLSGTPVEADIGANVFTVSVTDGNIPSPIEAQLDIEVLFVNDAPVVDAGEDDFVNIVISGSEEGWTFAPWTGDADSGISSANTYTAAHSFGNNNGTVSVNGVNFTEGFSTTGTNWSITGTKNDWNGNDDAAITGQSEKIAQEFIYNANPRTVTFSNLTPGQAYEANFYSVAWESSGRTQVFTATGAGLDTPTIAQSGYGNNQGIRITCVYVATAATQEFVIDPTGGATFHLYAMGNHETLLAGGTVALNGSALDEESAPMTYTWTDTGTGTGTGAVSFSDANILNPDVTLTELGTYVLRLTANDGNSDGYDEVTITVLDDTTNPTLASTDIVDDQGGAAVDAGTTVTYTVSFNEDIEASTVTPTDFTNAGTSSITIGTITETSPGVFSVEVTPTDAGSLQLQVPIGAVITDVVDNPLDTASAIVDDTTITVNNAPPYDSWALGFAGLSNSDSATDFDNGGLATGLEWVLGGDPTDAGDDKSIVPTVDASDANNMTFTFRRADAAEADSNTTIVVEYGSDMAFGSTATHGVDGVTFSVNDDGAGAGIDIVTVTIPKSLATGGKMFVRLKVTVTTP